MRQGEVVAGTFSLPLYNSREYHTRQYLITPPPMKHYTYLALALIGVGALSAHAETIVFAEYWGEDKAQTEATFYGSLFNDNWNDSGENPVLKADKNWLVPVYKSGINAKAEKTFYYDNALNSAPAKGNEPKIEVSNGTGTLSLVKTAKGDTAAAYWSTISTDVLSSVSNLSFSFTYRNNKSTNLTLGIFYLEEGSTVAGSVKRLLLETVSAAGDYTYDFTDAIKNADGGLIGGTFVIALRNTGDAWSNPTLSNITWSGTAIPEPSAFGLLLGLATLALAGTRRRR